MTIDERLAAVTMSLELTARQAEDSRRELAEQRAEREREQAAADRRHAEARAEADHHRSESLLEASDLRENVQSLARTVSVFIEAQQEFNRQFRQTDQLLARMIARHDDWIDRHDAA